MTNEIVKSEDNKVITYTDKQIQLIHDMYAKDTTKEEFELFLYTASKYQLDPLLKHIWCVKFKNQPAQIYAGRDGLNDVAHRSGQYDGMKSGTKYDDKGKLQGWSEVYRKDMTHPFSVEVDFEEYNTGQALWKSKPKTMIAKVAESQALKKAFSITGVYTPEEMGQWELEAQGIEFNKETPAELKQPQQSYQNTGSNEFDWSKLDLSKKPDWGYGDKRQTPKMIKRLFAISKKYGIPSEEFKSICANATEKEHSWEWTYGDIKQIEEILNTVNDSNTKQEQIIEAEIEPSNDLTDEDRADIEANFDKNIEHFEQTFDAIPKNNVKNTITAQLKKKGLI